ACRPRRAHLSVTCREARQPRRPRAAPATIAAMANSRTIPERPRIGIVGSRGSFGRWLARFFADRMGLETLGSDPADAASATPDELIERCDVLVFSAPIRSTPAIIRNYVAL